MSAMKFKGIWSICTMYLYKSVQNGQGINSVISKEIVQHDKFSSVKVGVESYVCKTNLDFFSFFFL